MWGWAGIPGATGVPSSLFSHGPHRQGPRWSLMVSPPRARRPRTIIHNEPGDNAADHARRDAILDAIGKMRADAEGNSILETALRCWEPMLRDLI